MTLQPTPEQEAIIDFVAKNPSSNLLIKAVAGAAKTSTVVMASSAITQRPACAVAFNKRIAEELSQRLPEGIECKTLNGLGHAAWGRVVGRCTLDTDKMIKLTKEVLGAAGRNSFREEDEDLLIEVLALARGAKSIGLVPRGAPMGKTGLVDDDIESWENLAFQKGFTIDQDHVTFARAVVNRSISQAYQKIIDFDDQIYMSTLFGGQYFKFHTTIVDEAQDLSPLNHLQLKMMTSVRLIAVGDPYQAIYAFRGADSNSMTNLVDTFGKPFTELSLTNSFRVAKAVGLRQVTHVPHFKSHDLTAEGQVLNWPLGGEASATPKGWSIGDIPASGAVLCRNNAPLMKLAFALIKARRPVKVLGREIGANLGNLLNKICSKERLPIDQAYAKLEDWREREAAKAAGSETKLDTINDRFECLQVLLDASGANNSLEAVTFIKDLFSDKAEGGPILASGHKAKGLEWEWVLHLDPWRVPSKFALRAAEHGNTSPLAQENNLRYVIETRTKNVLVEANLDNCIEMEKL